MRKELAVLAVLASASAAWADGIIYDGFNYDATGTPFLGSGPSGAAGPVAPGAGGGVGVSGEQCHRTAGGQRQRELHGYDVVRELGSVG